MDLLNRFEHPRAEKSSEMKARVMEAWDEIVGEAAGGDRIFVFCHGFGKVAKKKR